jgi:hypothetical protein
MKRTKEWNLGLIALIVTAWVSTLCAMLLLAVSPANADKLAQSGRPDWLTWLSISFQSANGFISGSIKAVPLPSLVTFLAGLAFAVIVLARIPGRTFSMPQWLARATLGLAIGFILIVGCAAPSAYAQSAYPEQRSLITARFVMVLAIAYLGWMLGEWVTARITPNRKWVPALAVVLLLGLNVYPLRSLNGILANYSGFQKWASFWDQRDQDIQALKAQGQKDIEVVRIDHIIPDVGDLSDDPGYWYNHCAAEYYGVDSIRANLPGWDK